jgi:hypothetical protein
MPRTAVEPATNLISHTGLHGGGGPAALQARYVGALSVIHGFGFRNPEMPLTRLRGPFWGRPPSVKPLQGDRVLQRIVPGIGSLEPFGV